MERLEAGHRRGGVVVTVAQSDIGRVRSRTTAARAGTTAQMGWLKSTYEGDSTLTAIRAMGGVLLMLGPGVGLDTRLFHDWQSSRDPTTSGGRWTTMGLAVGIAAFL
jgi:hypothetical protein